MHDSLVRYVQSVCLLDCHDARFVMQIADRLEHAVTAALDGGYRTGDLMSPGMKQVGCSELGNIIVKHITESKQ